jgi:hypothetical protein
MSFDCRTGEIQYPQIRVDIIVYPTASNEDVTYCTLTNINFYYTLIL